MKWVRRAAMGLAAAVVLVGLQLIYALYAPVAEPWPVAQSPEADTVDFRHYPYSQAVFAYLAELDQQFPELMDLAIIGRSHRGHPIVMCQITNRATGSALSKPAVLITAQLHAREPIAGQTALYAIKHLLENYGSDQLVTHLLDTRTVYIAPLVNPDGNDLFLSQDEQLRTNARPTDIDQDGKYDEDPRTYGFNSCCRTIISFKPIWMLRTKGKPWSERWPYDSEEGRYSNIRWIKEEWVTWRNKPITVPDRDGDGRFGEDYVAGVDLNRNWDAKWEHGIDDALSALYRGPGVFSEPEVRAIRDFVLSHPNIIMAVDVHSGVNQFIWPWSSSTEKPSETPVYLKLGAKLKELLETEELPFTYGQGSTGLYTAYGTIKDWLYQQGILAATLEVYLNPRGHLLARRRVWPTGIYVQYQSLAFRFNPPPADMPQLLQNRLQGLLYMMASLPDCGITNAEYSGGQLDLTVHNSSHIPVQTAVSVVQGQHSFFANLAGLSGSAQVVFPDIVPELPVVVTVDPTGLVAQAEREGERETLTLLPHADGTVEVLSGRMAPVLDLSSFFGGWSVDK